MNKTLSEVKDFFNAINILYKNEPVNVLAGIAPAYPFIYPCIECNNTPIKIFAQNVSIISCTSGVSIEQLKSLNVEYCLIWHADVRKCFTDAENFFLLEEKILKLIKNKIHVIFCVDFEINFKDPIVNGISNNQENLLENLFKHLIEKLLTDVFPDDIVNYLIIAYEPVSIIGSSQALSNNEIADKCKQIRSIIGNLNLDKEKIRILYAAGANKNNIRGIISNEDVDGVLVGKASLEPNEFYSLLMIADEINKLNQ